MKKIMSSTFSKFQLKISEASAKSPKSNIVAEQSLELVRVFHVDLEARPQISQLGIWDPFWGGTLFKKEQE